MACGLNQWGSRSQGSSNSGWYHCIAFLGGAVDPRGVSLHPVEYLMETSKLTLVDKPYDKPPFRFHAGRGEEGRLLVASC